jgi:hypothetical protein
MRYHTVQLLRALSVVILLPIAAAPVRAAVIYDNGRPADGVAFFSDPSMSFQIQVADNFLLPPASTTITDVHWWGAYAISGGIPPDVLPSTPPPDDFTISVYAADGRGGLPGTTVATRHVGGVERTPVPPFGCCASFFYEYTAVVAPITLTASVTYWLSIVNDTTTDPVLDWAWASSGYPRGDHALKQVLPILPEPLPLDWQLDIGKAAFNLTNDGVALPSTLILLATGLVGLATLRRKRRTRD